MTKTFIIKPGQRPTDDQIREALEAKKQPVIFDEDSPKMSPAMFKAFKSIITVSIISLIRIIVKEDASEIEGVSSSVILRNKEKHAIKIRYAAREYYFLI